MIFQLENGVLNQPILPYKAIVFIFIGVSVHFSKLLIILFDV